MTVKEIFKKAVIAGADPLSITELGFAYLNDIGTWNINIKNKTITVEQLLDIFEHHCTCFRTQNECFEDKRKEMIQLLKEHDPQATIDFN